MEKFVSLLALFAFCFVSHAQTKLATALMPPAPIKSPLPPAPATQSSVLEQLTPLQEFCKAQHDLATNMLAIVETDTNDFLVTTSGIAVLHPGEILANGSFDGITAMAIASSNETETVVGSHDFVNWTSLYSTSGQFPFFFYTDLASQPQEFYRTAHSQSLLPAPGITTNPPTLSLQIQIGGSGLANLLGLGANKGR